MEKHIFKLGGKQVTKMLIQTKLLGTLTYDTEEGLVMDATFPLEGQDVAIDLGLFDRITLPEDYQRIAMLVDQFPRLYAEAKTYLLAQMAEGNELINYYFEYHTEEVQEELLAHLKLDSMNQVTNHLLIEKLVLSGAFFSLDKNSDLDLTFDFKLLPEISDELLVVIFNKKGEVIGITQES